MSHGPTRLPTRGRTRRPARMKARITAAACTVTVLTAGLLFSDAVSASAHVLVVPDTTTPGSSALLTFRVPNEHPGAVTTQVTLTLPTSDPFPAVSVQPLAGWTTTVTDAKLPTPVVDDDGATLTRAAHTVTWIAQKGNGIGADQLQQFVISVGPLPRSGTVSIPATQTYSDGTVVAWNQPTPTGGAEPAHPAPTFTVGPATADTGSRPTGGPTVSASPAPDTTAGTPGQPAVRAASVSTTDGTARWLGGVGLVVGALGLTVGAVGLTAARRRHTR